MDLQEAARIAVEAAKRMEALSKKPDPDPCCADDPEETGVVTLIGSVIQVLRDEESQEGGWGPDVTMVAVLKDGLKAVGVDYDELKFNDGDR